MLLYLDIHCLLFILWLHRIPAEDRILRRGMGENKLLAVNGNHRAIEEGDGLSRRLFSVTGELLQALEHRHERHVLFARLDQPLVSCCRLWNTGMNAMSS